MSTQAEFGHSWFRSHADAVAEADRRAALTGLRYRVTHDAANGWWDIRETVRDVLENRDAR